MQISQGSNPERKKNITDLHFRLCEKVCFVLFPLQCQRQLISGAGVEIKLEVERRITVFPSLFYLSGQNWQVQSFLTLIKFNMSYLKNFSIFFNHHFHYLLYHHIKQYLHLHLHLRHHNNHKHHQRIPFVRPRVATQAITI